MYKEFFVYSTFFDNLAAGTGVAFTANEIRIDPDADFEFVKTIFQPVTARARIRYRDDTNTRFLQKAQQDIRTVGGHAIYSMAPATPRLAPGFVPFIWPRPYIIAPATTFSVEVADFSGLSYDLRISFHGSKLRPGKAPWDRPFRALVPYVYPITTAAAGTVNIPANGSASASIATDNDAHFLVQKIVGSRTGPCTVEIKDGARDRQWQDTPVHFDNMVGNGHYPNILPSPRFIYRGSVISFSLVDLSGASNDVEINLVGVKLYE